MRSLRRFLQVVAVAAVLTTAGSAWAQGLTKTWTGGGGNGNWSVGANWGGSAPTTAGDNLFFDGSTQLSTTNNFGDGFRVNKITFNPNAGAFTLGGASIILYEGINVSADPSSAVTHTINLNMSLQNSRSITTTTNGSIAVGGIISGSRTGISLTKGGLGLLTLNGANTFTGQMAIDEGTVSANTLYDAGTASSLGTGADWSIIRIGYGSGFGTLDYTGTGHSTNRQITIGSTAFNVHNGSASLLANGSGAVNFTASTFNAADSAAMASRTLTLGGNSTADNTIAGAIVNNRATTGLVAIRKQGAGKWILSGNSTYTGTSCE